MPNVPSKRLSTGQVVALVLVPVMGLLVLVGAVTGGWIYYTKFHSDRIPAASAPAGATASLDLNGAVAALRGKTQPETKAEALAALERLAKSGNVQAMVMTAACYRARLGTPKDDLFKAFEWYRKAAEAGEPVAMVEMARHYAEGVWVEANPAESKRWLDRSAKAGNAEAKWQLAKGGK